VLALEQLEVHAVLGDAGGDDLVVEGDRPELEVVLVGSPRVDPDSAQVPQCLAM